MPTKKRVLIIVENETVPLDSRVWKEACSLRDYGCRVVVLCPTGKSCSRHYEVLDGIQIYRHPATRERTGPLGYLLEYVSALFWEVLFSWWIYFRHGFDVIQGCNPPDDIVFIAWMFRWLGVKYIFDQHDANPELYVAKYGKKGLLYRIVVLLERITYKSADVVIATNQSYRQLAVTRGGVDPSDVYVVRNGPDLDTFQPVPPQPKLKNGKAHLVGYVGVMNEQDGLDLLLEVAAHIRSLGREDVQFTCVGSGSALPALREMAVAKGLTDRFTFTGRVSDEDLLAILSTADVCVNPDRPCEMNNISTMIKIMEYMALGKPIVQFESKEGRFSAQEASLYVGGASVAEFAEKVLFLLDHPDVAAKMGRFGQKRVKEALSWKHSIEHLHAAYDRAFGAPIGDPVTHEHICRQ